MVKPVTILLAVLTALILSCNQSGKTVDAQQTDTVLLTVSSFDTAADQYVEKLIWIEGTVYHTCKHGGKRLFLVDATDSIRVEVTTGPQIPKFEESMVGSRIKILGLVKEERIDDKYLNEWEAEVKKPKDEEHSGLHTGEKGHEDQSVQDKLDKINSLREQLKQSGKPYLSFFSIEAISFSEVK